MPKSLVIVESPTKARTISRFLGNDFIVESSYGHIRDLPRSKIGVDVEKNFNPQYIVPAKARAVVKKLKAELKGVDRVILATDEDREGEAIAWHLAHALDLETAEAKTTIPDEPATAQKTKRNKTKKQKIRTVERIVFHEITKRAIEEALKNPRTIDIKRVDAQQGRRILDRLVGYKLSPFLWKKVYRGLSAGRVQSVAVRLIVEREREIEKFKADEYWSVVATLAKKDGGKEQLTAALAKKNGEMLDKFAIQNEQGAHAIVSALEKASWTVEDVEKRAITKNPPPPFTTSTLQQEAFRRLGFSARQTMRLAQQLYEGIELDEGSVGLITYMRTDSVNLSAESTTTARDFIMKEFGDAYALPSPRRYKTKSKGAQEAHEAVRPTDPWRTPKSIQKFLDRKQFRLYELVWNRFLATQMPAASFDSTAVDILAATTQEGTYTFRATGQIIKFAGWLTIYPTKFTEALLPELTRKEILTFMSLAPLQHFTQPPPRFTEASLVKILEQNGIGRPSTYAPIISTVQDRGYVERMEKRQLKPTEVGYIVNDMLVEHFPEVVDIQFTAKMEEELDQVAEGGKEWQSVIKEFYEPFSTHLVGKYEEVEKHQITETTDQVCEKCGKPMIIRLGRFGKFLACSGFPECRNTKTIKSAPETIGMKCPKCTDGDIIIKRTKRRKVFFGCSRYPDCDFASWTDPRNPIAEKQENKNNEPEKPNR